MRFRTLFLIGCCFCVLPPPLYTDTYSGSSQEEALIVRAPVWVFLEPQPGVMEDQNVPTKMPPRKALTAVSAQVLQGMTYGWTFSYTPFDKKRNVAEEFVLTPVHELSPDDGRLHITELRPRYPYLYCWAEYRITDAMALRHQHWIRSTYVTAKGSGSGKRKDETEGVRQAYTAAAMDAVRSYLRKNEKNKPKYVSGEMLIKDNPRLYAASGSFTVELTVYLYIKEVVPYTVF